MKGTTETLGNPLGLMELLQHIPVPVAVIDPSSGEYVAVNSAMKQALGYGQDTSNSLLPQILNSQQWQCIRQGEMITEYELEICNSDNQIRNFSLSAQSIGWGGDHWILCVLHDITKYKKQELLQEWEGNAGVFERMQRFLAHSPCIFYIYDLDRHTLLYINRAQQLAGTNPLQHLVWAEDVPVLENHLAQCRHLILGQTLEVDYRILGEKQSLRWFRSYDSPFAIDSAGVVHQIAGVAIDITAQKQAELALAESEQRNRALLGAIPDLIMRLKRDGTCLECRPPKSAHQSLAVGHHISEGLPSPLAQKLLRAIATALEEQSLQVYVQEINKFGQICQEEVYVMPAGAEEVLVVVRDISDRQKLAEEREITQLQRRFFAVLSHEFRTPLSTILGSVELLQNSHAPWLDEKAKRNLNRIALAVQDALELLDNMLTLSRADAGSLQIKLQYIDLRRFTEELVDSLPTQRQIVVHCQTSGENYMGYADPFVLRRILVNLLNNAIKYSSPDTEIKVGLWISMEQDQAVWQVIDRGIGIKEQELEHIFTPWWRGSNAGHTRGSGIGLSVVQGCVKAMGGVITVQSRENVGTTFTVIIPITGTGEE